jgi:cobalt/nickel transport system ATP-binding protein
MMNLTKKLIYKLENISYMYGENIDALNSVSFEVEEGQMLGLLGANGSGKSTLLSIMGGLYFPCDGVIEFKGNELSQNSLREENFRKNFRKSVGIVFQNPDLQLFTGSVFEEICFGPLHLGFTKEQCHEIGENIISRFNLTALKERPPHSLSGGEKKRVAIASVLASEPEVLLLDEPTLGLDPKSAGQITDMIIELNESGKTVVSATNDMIAAPEIADRVIVLGENHRLLAEGSIEEILAKEDVLLGANLIHEHKHRHHGEIHKHRHTHLKPDHHIPKHSK